MIGQFLSSLLPSRRAMDFGPLSDFWYNPVGTTSSSGVIVKPDNAMRVSAVFACVTKLSEVLSQLDFRVFDTSGDKDKEARKHPAWSALYNKPNRWQTPIEWQAMGMAHLCLRGNYYNRIVINDEGETELVPLNPDRMTVEQMEDRRLRYIYRQKVGSEITLSNADMLHVRGLTLDGLVGVSVLEYARNAVGTCIAQETHGAALFKNGGLPTFWIGRPQGSRFTQEARRNFRAGWRTLHGGAENSGNPPILEDGMEIHELGMSNRDSQWIEARSFQAIEICRFFGVPPYMIGVQGEAARNIEQMGTEFVRYTLAPWSARWCQSIERDLIADRDKYCVRQNLEELEKGDKLSRYQAHNIAIQGGWQLPNEARAEEGWEPIEGGDIPRFPMNMQPAGGGPDEQQQGGQPGKPKPPKMEPADEGDSSYQQRKKDDEQKKKNTRKAFAVLLDDRAARIATAEIKGMEKRASKASENKTLWNAWATEFYVSQTSFIESTLSVTAKAWEIETGHIVDTRAIANSIFESASELFADDADVPVILKEWKTTRAAAVLAQLERAFFNEAI